MEEIVILLTSSVNFTVAVMNLTVVLLTKRKKKKNLHRHHQ
ncbi:hypothetical protein JOD43_002188 [Pullulanibacillus pueri]|nr:hypothetical protein [Pullulanibacillus pueri]